MDFLRTLHINWSSTCAGCELAGAQECANRFLIHQPAYLTAAWSPPQCDNANFRGVLIYKKVPAQSFQHPIVLFIAWTDVNVAETLEQLCLYAKLYRIFLPLTLSGFALSHEKSGKSNPFSPFWKLPSHLPNGDPFSIHLLLTDHPSLAQWRLRTTCSAGRDTLDFERADQFSPSALYPPYDSSQKFSVAAQELRHHLKVKYKWEDRWLSYTTGVKDEPIFTQKLNAVLAIPQLNLSVVREALEIPLAIWSQRHADFDKVRTIVKKKVVGVEVEVLHPPFLSLFLSFCISY